MSDDEIKFSKEEKLKFENLLNKLGWTKDSLLKEQEIFLQCPIDQGHRFPTRSKHVQTCQLIKEGFSKDYLKELAECEQEKQLLNQSGIVLTSLSLSNILHRPVTITTDIPISVEQTTVLFTPNERSIIAQTIYNEALQLGIVPIAPLSINDNLSIQSQTSTVSQRLDDLRDQKRRRMKYVTRTTRKSFYDIAREMINTEMELIEQVNRQIQNEDRIKHSKHRHSKHKHRSSSKKKKHRSSRRDSGKHHRHSKKRRTS